MSERATISSGPICGLEKFSFSATPQLIYISRAFALLIVALLFGCRDEYGACMNIVEASIHADAEEPNPQWLQQASIMCLDHEDYDQCVAARTAWWLEQGVLNSKAGALKNLELQSAKECRQYYSSLQEKEGK